MLSSRISKLYYSSFNKVIKVDNPYNYKIIANVKLQEDNEINKNITLSNNIYNEWKNVKLEERIKLINKWINVVESQKDKIAKETSLMMGKPIKQSLGEIQTMISRAKTMCELAPEALGEKIIAQPDAKNSLFKSIAREPVGIYMMFIVILIE